MFIGKLSQMKLTSTQKKYLKHRLVNVNLKYTKRHYTKRYSNIDK